MRIDRHGQWERLPAPLPSPDAGDAVDTSLMAEQPFAMPNAGRSRVALRDPKGDAGRASPRVRGHGSGRFRDARRSRVGCLRAAARTGYRRSTIGTALATRIRRSEAWLRTSVGHSRRARRQKPPRPRCSAPGRDDPAPARSWRASIQLWPARCPRRPACHGGASRPRRWYSVASHCQPAGTLKQLLESPLFRRRRPRPSE